MPGTLFPEIRVAMRKVEQVPSTTFENGEKVITIPTCISMIPADRSVIRILK